MKEKIRKEFLQRRRKLLETKLCCRNLSKSINTYAVYRVIYEKKGGKVLINIESYVDASIQDHFKKSQERLIIAVRNI